MLNYIDETNLLALMRLAGIPGLSIAEVSNGKFSDHKELGVIDAYSQTRVSANTIFGAASLSKALFAYLVLLLIHMNKSNPGLEFGKFQLPKGLSHFDLNTPLFKVLADEKLNRESTKTLALTAGLVLSHQLPVNPEFDKEFWYSGIPISYLQKSIEKLTGKSLEELAQTFVFKPLLMRHSSFIPPAGRNKVCAANSLFTTASDYARFIAAWITDERLRYAFNPVVSMTCDKWAVQQGLSPETLKKLAWGFGMGLQIIGDSKTTRTIAFHTGDMDKWRGWFVCDVNRKTAIVFFANSPNGHMLAKPIISSTIGLEVGLPYFFDKFGFTQEIEAGETTEVWQAKEQARIDRIKIFQQRNIPRWQEQLWEWLQHLEARERAVTTHFQHQTGSALTRWLIKKAEIPGIAIARISPDCEITTEVIGVTNMLTPSAITSRTVVEAASLSKLVVVHIVLRMVEHGELNLDQPLYQIASFGPPMLRSHPYYELLTVRKILSHQAGLPNWFSPGQAEDYLAKPGKRFDYSGLAFCFLNDVIEQVSGKTLENLAQQLFKDLAMTNSSFMLQEKESFKRENRAIGHDAEGRPTEKEHFPRGSRPNPAASLFTTVEDYAKFINACIHDPFINKYLFEPQIELCGTDKKAIDAGVSSTILGRISWGMGIGLQRTHEGSMIAFQWGDVETCTAFTAINLTTKQAMVCFTNSANGPRIFPQIAEPVVGDLSAAFLWLSRRENLTLHMPPTMSSLSNNGFFRLIEDKYLSEHRHDDPNLQQAYDKRFGLIVRKE